MDTYRRRSALISLLYILALTIYPLCAQASFYKYTDETGGINVTNDYKSIPKRYRAAVTVITEKELDNRSNSRKNTEQTRNDNGPHNKRQLNKESAPIEKTTNESSPTSSAEQKDATSTPVKNNNSWLAHQLPMLKIIAIVALLITAFVFLGRFVSALAPRPLAIIIRVAMFAALSVYLFKGFSEKAVDAFARIKEDSGTAQKAIDKRSERIQQQAD